MLTTSPGKNRNNAQKKGEEKLAAPLNLVDAGDFFIFSLQAVHQILARKAADAVGDGDAHQQAGQIDQKGGGQGEQQPRRRVQHQQGEKDGQGFDGIGRPAPPGRPATGCPAYTGRILSTLTASLFGRYSATSASMTTKGRIFAMVIRISATRFLMSVPPSWIHRVVYHQNPTKSACR